VTPKHAVTAIIKRIKEIVAFEGVYSESRYTHNRMQTPRVKIVVCTRKAPVEALQLNRPDLLFINTAVYLGITFSRA
jgi:hypothetical protein